MRSILGQNLKKAASIAREANERNISVDQVIAERMEKAISRRDFLKGTALVAAAVAVPPTLWSMGASAAKAEAKTSQKIVVVGAGLAGLTCAYRLKTKGIEAEVYEAAKRVGGRCYTRRGDFADSQIAEHGGELIDTEHQDIRKLAKELGLTLDDLPAAELSGTEEIYYIDNAPYSLRDIANDFQQILPIIERDAKDAGDYSYASSTARAQELDRMSVADWIRDNVPGGLKSRMGRLLRVAFTANSGAEIKEQSALILMETFGSYKPHGNVSFTGSSDERFHVRGGNDLIPTRMAEVLKGQINTEHELIAIKKEKDGGYKLTFRTGETTKDVKADQVVLALPFSILGSSVDFSQAGFSRLKSRVIRELGFGSCSKLNVQFTDRHWRTLGLNGSSYGDRGYANVWEVSRNQSGQAGLMVSFTGGDIAKTFANGDPQAHAQTLLKQLEPVFPGITGKWNGKATVDYWPSYKWTKGAYSYFGVGQYTKFYGAAAEPEENCYFAGEHTAEYYGFLNGAVESGERTAQQILQSQKVAKQA
ncbi:NAD(P)/FAD-dependent oxidoreductase [Brevibacillus fluminis]|uniref:NAD(P)/FAD-dependent oxidoreductase n=1 Tax=Brevibacillus fluminis TaxID=511487 RepID=A0A3M8DFL0_9BACL|nr:NAD(P)/FAD-dependent oxidoreductase [Brevibacillus fluminis]RNB86920.1 NAD(P)/FAD-dependent oxidoreductase [Brevibacillus fluminis]